MIKKLIVLALTLFCVSAIPCNVYAEDNDGRGISLEVGADLVSSYLWRGYNLGGLSIQPSVTFDWRGLYLSGWANVGADSWTFQELNPELDITIGYENYGFALDLTHLYYFGGSKYFKGLGDANNAFSYNTMELHAGIALGEWVEKVPLSLDWYTTVLGYDPVLDDNGITIVNANGNAKRAYSTYIELGYDIELPLDIVLSLKLGFTPWRGMYSDNAEVWTNGRTVGINNLQLRAEREFELRNLYINVWGEAMFNCYGANKNNIINTVGEADTQKLNACIGCGIYFGNDW
jgi:hypothetical protein